MKEHNYTVLQLIRVFIFTGFTSTKHYITIVSKLLEFENQSPMKKVRFVMDALLTLYYLIVYKQSTFDTCQMRLDIDESTEIYGNYCCKVQKCLGIIVVKYRNVWELLL